MGGLAFDADGFVHFLTDEWGVPSIKENLANVVWIKLTETCVYNIHSMPVLDLFDQGFESLS